MSLFSIILNINSCSLLPFITDEQQFFNLKDKIIRQPTSQQSKVATRTATGDIHNPPINEPSIQLSEKPKTTTKGIQNNLIVHYTYEKRFKSLARNIHQNYDKVFKPTNAITLRLIAATRNRTNSKKQLIHKRPKRSILQSQQIKEKYLKFLEKRKKSKTTLNQSTIILGD